VNQTWLDVAHHPAGRGQPEPLRCLVHVRPQQARRPARAVRAAGSTPTASSSDKSIISQPSHDAP